MSGIIYILLNDSMPGLVKIGMTENLERRMKDLYNTSVPTPFQLFYAKDVENCEFTEKKIHEAFGDFRVNENREFFRINPVRVQAVLELVPGNEINILQKNIIEDQRDIEAMEKQQKRRDRFRFSMVNIDKNTILSFVNNPEITCKVVDDINIEFENEVMSLSKAAGIILERNGKSGNVAGTAYWTHNAQTLWDLRNEMEE